MSNKTASALAGSDEANGSGASASRCQAPELIGLLERITSQIAESERRQSESYTQMLNRLDALGAEARSYKGRVPNAFLPAFERIEDGVAMLADRIASARGDAPAATADAAVPAAAGKSAPLAAEASPVASGPAVKAAAAPSPATTAPAAALDPEAVLANDETAWDAEAADALARHYESGAASFATPATAVPERAGGSKPVRKPASSAAATAPALPGPALAGVERSWLEERFTDIARRVEESLAGIAPDTSRDEFGSRFDRLEQRFGSALDGIATRTDVESLGLLEQHIAELTQQFDEARAQLGRLDGIEQTLTAVVDRLTDPRFDEILSRGGVPDTDLEPLISAAVEQIAERLKDTRGAAASDIASVANAAAERVATRFADFGSQPDGGSGDMSAIRDLLESFINERREGDEQTAAMLDTMQQAMIRVLDRVDAIETAHSKTTPQEYVREQVRFNVDAPASTASAQKAVDAASAFAAEARGNSYEPRRPAPTAAHTAAQGTEAEGSDRPFARSLHDPEAAPPIAIVGGAPAASASNSPRAGGATVERLRNDFIADAQRAKEKAAAAAEAGAAVEAKPRAAIGETLAGALPIGRSRAPHTDAVKPAPAGRLSLARMPSRKILVSALVLLVAIPGILMIAQKRAAKTTSQPEAAKVERPLEKGAAKIAPAAATPAEPAAEVAPAAAGAEAPKNAPAPAAAEPHDASKPPARAPEQRSDAETGAVDPAPARTAGLEHGFAQLSAAGAAPDADAPAGIHVATPAKAPTLEQLHRLQHRQSMAELSSKLGAAQQPSPTLAALIPEAKNADDGRELAAGGSAANDRLGEVSRKPLDIPVAAIGPLSLRMAAANGDPSAEFEVGARFAEGNGVPQNFPEAARWYQRAATQGFVQAQYRLATLYERGLGLKQDLARAKAWYQRAAEGGNVKAMHNLAVLSAGRSAPTPDYAGAATWFTAAAERGLADSQFNLAVLYEGGLGVAKDAKTAYKWYAIAARAGDQEATRRRDELERNLPAAELTAAKALVSGWRNVQTDRIANDPRAAGEEWKSRASASGY